nr:coat protein [Cymbidium chlorotic mosaic virus]
MAKRKSRRRPAKVTEILVEAPTNQSRARRRSSTNPSTGLRLSRPVTMPAAAGIVFGKSVPRLRSEGVSTILTNCEVNLGVVVTTGVTQVVRECAPFEVGQWLAGIAANFSKWRWLRLRFLYVPYCPTTLQGSLHMGFVYDDLDSNPTTVEAMSTLSGYTTSPLWNGAQCAPALSSVKSVVPTGSVCAVLDVTRLSKPWYPFLTAAGYTDVTETTTALGNMYSPGKLVILTIDGSSSTAVGCGRLYAQYEIELIEPIASSLNR